MYYLIYITERRLSLTISYFLIKKVEGTSFYTQQLNQRKQSNTTRMKRFILANASLIKDRNEEMLSVIA